MIIVRPAPPAHYAWLSQKANLTIGSGFGAIEAVDEDRILGMVGYDAWTPNSCAMHVAIEEPIAVRKLLGPSFRIPFEDPPKGCGRGVVFASVLSTNKKSIRFTKHLGFRQVATLKDAWAHGVDVLFFEMRKKDCRWLR